MPNKTIYVADDDLPLFQRAQELVGGNLSGAVVTALRRFIELEEGRQEGFEEVVLRVGHNGVRQVRFEGSLLGEWRDMNDTRMEHLRVFRSRKGKFVLHSQISNWDEYPDVTVKDWTSWKSWRRMLAGPSDADWGDFALEIVDTLAELKGKMPDKLFQRVADIADRPPIEELDI
ncbi:EXLDI protein [Nocardia cyriacigeorgica]|uniref:EXLDI protein n=1 Tax=Nocardia cyriacigeorgica TaxID=135487 RepID=UPI0018948AA6|nr:EXLDI protein [Nocardia cyriacigeorgica]MBF6085885.1 EXLDI protein [Nocardia cyriacigeorgica]MBF6394379.1 EXLDI protein [Nocardia cyriacigeorgica]MBF6400014.1 EXLDI protein [Nocardia cyriacigeorgica]MBF6495196.1 EXLDI protein [Nocardia cyriacigeorgica]